MTARRSAIAALTLCLAAVLGTACGGGSGTSAARFCKDYPALANVQGSDVASISRAASMFRTLAHEVPDSQTRADLNQVADSEAKAASGDAISVDEDATNAAVDRADAYAERTCNSK